MLLDQRPLWIQTEAGPSTGLPTVNQTGHLELSAVTPEPMVPDQSVAPGAAMNGSVLEREESLECCV